MGKFELIDVCYTEKDAQMTKKQLISQGLTVDIRRGTSPATKQPIWKIFGKKAHK